MTDWKELIREGESEHLEFNATAQLEQVGATVCAFLNGGGGRLVLGVSEKEVRGFEEPAKIRFTVLEDLERNLSPRAPYSAIEETIAEKSCLIIDVPSGAGLPYLYDGRIYLRRGNATVRASSSDITRLIVHRQQGAIRWERYLALGAETDDLDSFQIMLTALDMEERRYLSFVAGTPQVALERLNLIEGDSLRNSAVVLFGKEPQRLFPQTRIRVAHFAKEDRSVFLDSRYLEGNAFKLLEQLENFLQQRIPISSQILPHRLDREDRPAYPFPAVREAILNAIVHRDYAAYDGGMSVELYADRMEIENSGRLPPGLSVQGLKQDHASQAHNPDIAYVFFLRGLIERFGTGTQRIVAACLDWGLPEPEWTERNGAIKLTLRLTPPVKSVSAKSLNLYQNRLLKALKEHDRITAQQYHTQFATEISDRQARSHLNQLIEQGFLRREGNGPHTAYVRTEKPWAV